MEDNESRHGPSGRLDTVEMDADTEYKDAKKMKSGYTKC